MRFLTSIKRFGRRKMTPGPTDTTKGKSRIRVGRFTYGHDTLNVLEWGEGASLTIGAFCSIARESEVYLGGNHRVDWVSTYPFGSLFRDRLGGEDIVHPPAIRRDVTIGNDVWLGREIRIMSGVTIADGAVIAAGSVVSSDVGPYEIWGGNPARKIRQRFSQDVIDGFMDLRWWTWPEEAIRKAAPLLVQQPTPEVVARLAALRP